MDNTTSRAADRWAKAIKDAYEEGCWAISTYNDEPTETVDEAWERSDAKCAHDAAIAASAPVAPAPQPTVPNLTLEPEMRAAMQEAFDAESVPVRSAPLQQGEHLPLPGGVFRIDPGSGGSIVGYSADQMHAYADATCASRGQALRLLTQKEKDSLGRRAEGMDGNEWDQWVQEKFAQVNGLRVQGGSYEWDWE